MKRTGIYLLLLLAAVSCGIARHAPPVRQGEAPKILPLTDSAEIARSQARGRAVMDSIARARSAAALPPASDTTVLRQDPAAAQPDDKELVDRILDYARTFIGVPYRLGATGPNQFDCSGFTRYVFKEFGFELARNSASQFQTTRPVDGYGDLRKGDLVFFGARGSIREVGHVGIVTEVDLERGMFYFIHASTSHGIEIQRSTHPYFMMRFLGAGRVLPD